MAMPHLRVSHEPLAAVTRGGQAMTDVTQVTQVTQVNPVASRLQSAWKFRCAALAIYSLAVLSKRWVMPTVPRAPPELFWQVDAAYFILLPLCLYWLGWCGSRRSPAPVHDTAESRLADDLNAFNTVTFGVWLFFFIWFVWSMAGRVYGFWEWADGWQIAPTFNYAEHFSKVHMWRWLGVLYVAITAAVVEEFFFRKAFWQVLSAVSGSRVLSRVLYVGLSSFVFGLGHWASGSQAVFQAFAVGILLAVSYVKLRRLAPLVIGHCLADVVLFV